LVCCIFCLLLFLLLFVDCCSLSFVFFVIILFIFCQFESFALPDQEIRHDRGIYNEVL
jgi:hypothetical protein